MPRVAAVRPLSPKMIKKDYAHRWLRAIWQYTLPLVPQCRSHGAGRGGFTFNFYYKVLISNV